LKKLLTMDHWGNFHAVPNEIKKTKILLFSHKYPPEKIISKYGTARNKFETARRNKANNRCSF